MSHTIKLNEHIYFLLIEKQIDHFTVTSLRDELRKICSEYENPQEARLFVYKQIRRLAKYHLLVRDDNNSPMNARYSKTILFKAADFMKKTNRYHIGSLCLNTKQVASENNFKSDLNQVQKDCESEILLIISEIEEYGRLMQKYPSNINTILPCCEKAKTRLLLQKGKLAALKNIQKN
jgi:hypothetical protein